VCGSQFGVVSAKGEKVQQERREVQYFRFYLMSIYKLLSCKPSTARLDVQASGVASTNGEL
jgi:hypothetical protein